MQAAPGTFPYALRLVVDFVQFAEAVRTLGLYWLVINQPSIRRP